MRLVLASLALLLAVPALGQGMGGRGAGLPAALYADPAPDDKNPASLANIAIPSHGEQLIGQILLPSGPGPHPLLILYHGFPGYELSLDVGHAARRQGWAVVAFHYRGSWGSPGRFSFSHVVEDGRAVVDWLLAPEQIVRFKLDPARVVVAGHSMGGFAAAQTTAARPQIRGLVLMDAWNPGISARASSVEDMTKFYSRSLGPLAGTTPEALAIDNKTNADTFDIRNQAAAIATRPVLFMSSLQLFAAENTALAAKLREAGGVAVTAHEWPTDHSFSDHRIKLTTTTLEWLSQFETKR